MPHAQQTLISPQIEHFDSLGLCGFGDRLSFTAHTQHAYDVTLNLAIPTHSSLVFFSDILLPIYVFFSGINFYSG